MRFWRFDVLLVAVAAGAVVCSAWDARAASRGMLQEAQEAGQRAMRVELLEAGSEPRRALRYGAGGEVEKFVVEIESSVRAEREGGGAEMPMEELSLVLEVEQRVEARGEQFVVTARIVSADTNRGGAEGGDGPEGAESIQAAMVRRMLRRLAGVEVRTVRDARGVVLSDGVRVPEDADAATGQIAEGLKYALMQTVVPLPEEAVGEGARWRVRVPLMDRGIEMVRDVEYEAESMEGEAVGLRMEVASRAGPQEVRGVRVESFEGRGEGSADVRLGRMAAARMEVDVASRMESRAGGRARVQRIGVRTVVRER